MPQEDPPADYRGETPLPQTIRNPKRSELLAQEIVEEVLERGLRPGDLLPPESAMLARYQVGRASLREALRILETQGFVSLKPGPGGGPVVGAVDPTNLGRTASLYFRLDGATCGVLAEAMLILDPWLAELAASRVDAGQAEQLLSERLKRADVVVGDVGGVWRTAPQFHDSVYLLSGNAVLKTVAAALGSIFRQQVLEVVDLASEQPRFLEEHHRIAEAILAGQPSVARQLAHSHMASIIEVAFNQIKGLADRVIEWH